MLQDSPDESQKWQFMASASVRRSPAPEAAPFSPSPMVLSVCVCVCVCVSLFVAGGFLPFAACLVLFGVAKENL